MASLAHVSVGLAAGTWRASQGASAWAVITYSVLALLPDADVLAFAFHVPYANQFGHRGATHSVVFALAIAALARVVFRKPWRVAALISAVVASHPMLDMLTDGGLGCALWWPLSQQRLFWPWRPLPVAPIGLGMLSSRGLRVLALEAAVTSPLLCWVVWRLRRLIVLKHG